MGLWQQSYIFYLIFDINKSTWNLLFYLKMDFIIDFIFTTMILAVFVLYESYEYNVLQTAKD